MITNILLGLILAVVITSFIILNIKINGINGTINYIANYLPNIDKINLTNNKHIEHLLDRFNKKVLQDNEHCVINANNYNNIMVLLKSRFKDLDNATDSIHDRFNTTDGLIVAEHRLTRRQIEKQAKISSKINPKQKQSKSTQK